jgi:hypothetical protein
VLGNDRPWEEFRRKVSERMQRIVVLAFPEKSS